MVRDVANLEKSLGSWESGFTLVELLIVLTIMATILSIAAPRFFQSVERAKESALRTDLRVLREAIDKHRADTGQFPDSLQRLAERRYIATVPVDPMTKSALEWTIVPHPDGVTPGVFDVHSGATGLARDGSNLSAW